MKIRKEKVFSSMNRFSHLLNFKVNFLPVRIFSFREEYFSQCWKIEMINMIHFSLFFLTQKSFLPSRIDPISHLVSRLFFFLPPAFFSPGYSNPVNRVIKKFTKQQKKKTRESDSVRRKGRN